MEVKPGYKKTEMGIVPEEWEVVSVEKLVEEHILAKPLDGNHGNIHPKSSDYVDYGIPFVMANNFENGRVNLERCKFITKERADKLQKGFSVSGDVLLTHKGTVGNTAIVGELSTEYIMLTPQVTYYRVTDGILLNNEFLRHYFDSHPFQSLFTSLAGGGTRAYIGIVKQLALPIVKPPIAEQRAIATALSDVDALLGGLDRLIAKKRDLKQAAMQQLLTGQTRLPGFCGSSKFIKTEVGLIPDDWHIEKINNISIVGRGRVISHREIAAARSPIYPVYSSQTSDDGVMGYLDTFQFEGEYITWTTDGANAGTVFYRNGRFNCTNVCGTIKLKKDNTGFVSRVLAGIAPRYVSRNLGNPKLMNDVMKHIPVPLPTSLLEQAAIAAVRSDMDLELSALEIRRDKTRALKQAMMQELLTGRTRLVNG